jgi:hypothetical protein
VVNIFLIKDCRGMTIRALLTGCNTFGNVTHSVMCYRETWGNFVRRYGAGTLPTWRAVRTTSGAAISSPSQSLTCHPPASRPRLPVSRCSEVSSRRCHASTHCLLRPPNHRQPLPSRCLTTHRMASQFGRGCEMPPGGETRVLFQVMGKGANLVQSIRVVTGPCQAFVQHPLVCANWMQVRLRTLEWQSHQNPTLAMGGQCEGEVCRGCFDAVCMATSPAVLGPCSANVTCLRLESVTLF